MKILVLSGSKNPKGKTAQAISALIKGVAKAGGDAECLFLTQQKLEVCRQCNDDGWGICRGEHRCIIEDDFPSIVEKIRSADVVVFATPVYFGDLSEAMRGFLDRLRRIRFTFGGPPAAGGPRGEPAAQRTPAVGLCYAGGSGNGTASCIMFLERTLQQAGFDVVDLILTRRQNLEAKMPMLELTGQWLVTKPSSGKMPFMPPR